MTELFLDSSVPLLAAGADHPQRNHCRALLSKAGAVQFHLSVEAIQEFVHHRMRMSSRAEALREARGLTDLCVVHAFDASVLDTSLDLIAASSIRGRDAVHAATALNAGFTAIVTTDRDFAGVPGLGVISPAEALA